MTDARFADKVVVITGGASGIGRACALAFGRAGASVVIADLNADRLAEVGKELQDLGVPALTQVCDVSKDAEVDRLAQAVKARFSRTDILMNNAGVMLRGPLEKMPIAEWEWIFGINLFGPIRGLRAFLPDMIARGSGHIINTASLGGLIGGRPHSAGYSASKFALVGLSETLFVYLKPKGIGVSVLCPGGVKTNLPEQIRLSAEAESAEGYGLGEAFGSDAVEPDAVAQMVLEGVATGQFLILTDPRHQALLTHRVTNLQTFVENRARAGG